MYFYKVFNVLSIVWLILIVLDVKYGLCKALNEVMYSFRYGVEAAHLGLLTHHFEERKADLVQGSYSLLQPDGKIRIVQYKVDDSRGFRAFVTYRKPPEQIRTPVLTMPKTLSWGNERGYNRATLEWTSKFSTLLQKTNTLCETGRVYNIGCLARAQHLSELFSLERINQTPAKTIEDKNYRTTTRESEIELCADVWYFYENFRRFMESNLPNYHVSKAYFFL